MKEIKAFIIKDIRYELRKQSTINGLILYMAAIVFIAYLSFLHVYAIDENTWNALYWIILIFASMNAVSGTFVNENANRQYYFYLLAKPRSIILSKIAYNAVLVLMLSLLSYLLFILFMGNKAQNQVMFVLNIILGSTGLSAILTFVSAISSRTDNNFTLMAILGFPLLLPFLLILMKIAACAISGNAWDTVILFFLLIIILDALVLLLAIILFPYLWRD